MNFKLVVLKFLIIGIQLFSLQVFCSPGESTLHPEVSEEFSSDISKEFSQAFLTALFYTLAGETSVEDRTINSFGNPLKNSTREQRRTFATGNSFFRLPWVSAPSSTEARDGLGPTFNAVSCGSCHGLDGRAPPFLDGVVQPALLFRLSHPNKDASKGWAFDSHYGDQFNPSSILGVPSEGDVTVLFEYLNDIFKDGEAYELRKPKFTFSKLSFGLFDDETQVSPRAAPQLIGMGLLEAIPELVLLEYEDPKDSNNDGISGRSNRVFNQRTKKVEIGRFGWKANQPSVEQQNAGAFVGDMGLTSSLFPKENCPLVQLECRGAIPGGTPEVSDAILDRVTLYTQLLAVPKPRFESKQQFEIGFQSFTKVGCHQCHRVSMTTAGHAINQLNGHLISPFTDLLLHDMGEGLEDKRPDHKANGREWRTPPLWGLGLIKTVNGSRQLLHDGRARTLNEAILWHGGEASKSRKLFKSLTAAERKSLLGFLESL